MAFLIDSEKIRQNYSSIIGKGTVVLKFKASADIGLGHLFRMITLASYLGGREVICAINNDKYITERLEKENLRFVVNDFETEKEFAILTNEISKATFGKTVAEYKEFKQLQKKKQNLRDHMTDWELILTMFGEKATTDITIAKDSKGFNECKDSAVEGGTIAQNTRKEIEHKTGKSTISRDNYLHLAEKKKQIQHHKKDK